jgi:hypothetical protein
MSTQQPSGLLDRAMDRFQLMIGSLVSPERSPLPEKEAPTSSSKESEIDLLALGIELTVRAVAGYMVLWLTQRLIKGVLDENNGAGDRTPAAAVYRRLQAILVKRGHDVKSMPTLTSYERQMAEEIIEYVGLDNGLLVV